MDEPAPLQRLRTIVARLRAPDGCPWDREQTHSSLRGDLLEEAYEVVETIDSGDDLHFREELGDLLLQVVMHSQLAEEEGRFDLDEVATLIADKLVRRHPHVFGEMRLGDSESVLKQWDEIKREERGFETSAMDGVSQALPALMRAEKVQKRAARVGFDWSELGPVLAKIREEIEEVAGEIESGDHGALGGEIGDLLFSVVNLARKLKIDPEIALQHATRKFETRFRHMEREILARGEQLHSSSLDQLDAVWETIKSRE
jgi:MazG family protein